jgi:hypothetical protein
MTIRPPLLPALLAALCLGAPATLAAQAAVAVSPDAEGVSLAARDYIEAFYEGDSTKIVRSVSPTVVKYGYYIPKGDSTYHGTGMSYAQMLDYVRQVKASGRSTPASAPRMVTLLEVLDQIAAAKVVAWWGTDYLHLAKIDGRWMITQVIWQSPPRDTR